MTANITIDLSKEKAYPNTICLKAGTTCVHMNAAQTRATIKALEIALAKALERWTECPHGELIPPTEDGPCGCRAGAYTINE